MSIVLLIGVVASSVAPSASGQSAGELIVEIAPGVDQKRNFDRPGAWTAQWVRRLPPDGEPWVLTCQGPKSWEQEPVPTALAEGIERNRDHLAVLRQALESEQLLTASQRPATAAATLMAALRPVELDGTTVAHQSRVWLVWEILAAATQADTLSVSVAVLQGLQELGVDARLALYPTADQGNFYGVLVADTRPAGPGWGVAAGDRVLIPASPSASPVEGQVEALLTSWSWSEILSPDWLAQQIELGPGSGPGARPGGEISRDLCEQARALGLECVDADLAAEREWTYGVLSAVVLLFLGLWMVNLWRQRRRRQERVSRRQREKEEREF